MSTIHIKNGRIIDPSQNIDTTGDIYVCDGKIVSEIKGEADKVIDASGMWVTPGLIDVHVHLREPGQEHKESIETGTAAAAAGGFTTVVAMPNTTPCADNSEVINKVQNKATSFGGTKVIQSCAITLDRAGKELADFEKIVNETSVKIFTDDGDGVSDEKIMEEALTKSAAMKVYLSQHSEFSDISKKAPIHCGPVSKELGVEGQPIESEDNMVFRDIALTRKTGGYLHVSHISSKNAIEAVRNAKKEGLNVTAEVTPHHLHLTDETVNEAGTIAKVAPPLRPNEHMIACREALADGTIDVIATDHAPHTFEDKTGTIDKAAFGMVGLEISVPMILSLVKQEIITPVKMVDAMSCAPARIFEIEGGTLKPGSVADITIINPDNPFIIDPRTFKSKGRNTPFAETRAPGQTHTTIVNGKVVYQS